jgi:antitoxin (DNA-binding transcriptional repressor) of toxin-antitoxin stability system
MSPLNRPDRTITVGQLRQNPSGMIHDVEEGNEHVLTDRGRKVARIVPYFEPSWVPADEIMGLLNTATDPSWLSDVQSGRSDSDMIDPWEA